MRILIFTTSLFLSIIIVLGQEKEKSCETDYYTTAKGLVCGAIEETDSSKKYMAFYEIPYAEPPVDQRRFMPPEPAQSWEAPLDASVSQSIMCSQPEFGTD